MFKGAAGQPRRCKLDLSAATNLTSMFENATSARPETGAWDLSSVTRLERMFKGATSANPDVSAWDIGLVPVSPGSPGGAGRLGNSGPQCDVSTPGSTKEYSDFLVYLRDNNAQTVTSGGTSTYNAMARARGRHSLTRG